MRSGLQLKLRNGSLVDSSLVNRVTVKLQFLMSKDCAAYYELVCLARDTNHQIGSRRLATLQVCNLLDPSGQMPPDIRNIVLSAAVGDGLDMGLQSPVHPADQRHLSPARG